jgi:hypothetical protein
MTYGVLWTGWTLNLIVTFFILSIKNIYMCRSNANRSVRRYKKKATTQIGTRVRARVFESRTAGYKSVRIRNSCDRTSPWKFSVVFLGPSANVTLVPKFHVALHTSHVALLILTSKLRLKIVCPMLTSKLQHTQPSGVSVWIRGSDPMQWDPVQLLSLLHISSLYILHTRSFNLLFNLI